MTVALSGGGTVITFYSYKGGTGRTSALSNVACLLASDPAKRVLAVDFDLEAPGLHRYFPEVSPSLTDDGGVMEILDTLEEATRDLASMTEHAREKHLLQITSGLPLTRYARPTRVERLDVITAGRLDVEYPSKVAEFDWIGIYERAPELMPLLARRLATDYTHVLIDSRTGLNDISGICTAVLPEKLVVVFTPNEQNVAGAADVVWRAANHRRESDDLRRLVIYPLPSRIENAEPTERDRWRFGDASGFDGYQPRFERIFREAYGIESCDLSNYFDTVQIQHAPFYSFGEKIAVEIERSREVTSLASAYQRFAMWIERDAPPWTVAVDVIPKYAQALLDRLGGTPDAREGEEETFVVPHFTMHGKRIAFSELPPTGPLLITGGAGMGKSTLLAWLACSHARRLLGIMSPSGEPALLPVLIPVGRLETGHAAKSSLIDLVRNEASRFMVDEIEAIPIQTAIMTRVRLGQLLILLDDVDLANNPRLFAEGVAEFTAAYPRCRVIATARTPQTFPETVRAEVADLAPFDEAQQRELLRSMGGSPAGADTLEKLVSGWDKGNPLLLRSFKSLAQEGGANEYQILRDFVNLLLRRETERTEIPVRAMLQLLTTLAARTIDRGSAWLSEKEVRRAMTDAKLTARRDVDDKLALLGTFLIREAPGAAWASRFSFVSATLRDYLAALALVSNGNEPDLRRLQEWLARPDRLERIPIIRLASLAAGEAADSMLHEILGTGNARDEEEATERAIIAAAALAEQPQASQTTAIRVIVAFAAAIAEPKYASYGPIAEQLLRGPWSHVLREMIQPRTTQTSYPLQAAEDVTNTLRAAAEAAQNGDLARAVSYYTDVLVLPGLRGLPVYYQILQRRGYILNALERHEDALADFESIVRAGPHEDTDLFAHALMGKARSLALLERYDEALVTVGKVHDVVQRQDPDAIELLADATFHETLVLAQSNRTDEALQAVDRLVASYGERPETAIAATVAQALLLRAEVLIRGDRLRDASLALQEVVVRTARRTDLARFTQRAQLRQAFVLVGLGNRDSAIRVLDEVLQRHRSTRAEANPDIEQAERLLAKLTGDQERER